MSGVCAKKARKSGFSQKLLKKAAVLPLFLLLFRRKGAEARRAREKGAFSFFQMP